MILYVIFITKSYPIDGFDVRMDNNPYPLILEAPLIGRAPFYNVMDAYAALEHSGCGEVITTHFGI